MGEIITQYYAWLSSLAGLLTFPLSKLANTLDFPLASRCCLGPDRRDGALPVEWQRGHPGLSIA